jgi:GT2 family glycosyltransferase
MIDCKKVFVIIVSWNGAHWLPGALGSLRKSTYPVKPVVVDNASSDETADVLRHFPEAHVIGLPTNLGFGRANNQGLCYALSQGADYVLLLNQDAWVTPSAIELLVSCSAEHPEFGVLSPLHLDYSGTRLDQAFAQQTRKSHILLSDALIGSLSPLYELSFINAAIWLLTRRVIEDVGGFDPLFFMYGEDNDYCERARFRGFRIGLVPAARGCHWHMMDRRRMTFSTRVNKAYVTSLLELKQPDKSFGHNLAIAAATSMRRLVFAAMRPYWQDLLPIAYATAKAVLRLGTAHKHYRLCQKTGAFLGIYYT